MVGDPEPRRRDVSGTRTWPRTRCRWPRVTPAHPAVGDVPWARCPPPPCCGADRLRGAVRPALRSAGPVVLAGVADLGRQVRWVHTTELVDTAPLLRGGDLVLSTGIASRTVPTTWRRSPAASTAARLPDSSSSWDGAGPRSRQGWWPRASGCRCRSSRPGPPPAARPAA
ncbi:PucR family transcriptional regulator ligand-binding domain-containing protein [Geodermatophilus sp. URMC 65]